MSLRASIIKLTLFTIVTVAVTIVLANTIGNVRPGDYHSYRAAFSDITGVLRGDDIRVAGVRVGVVTGTKVVDDHAEVRFTVDKSVRLTSSTRAKVRYRNLIGQRYIALVPSAGGDRLRSGALIPLGQTEPALDLTALFNGFRPILETVQPEDVNALAMEIVRTLQGEGGTIDSLLARTASLTTTLAQRDAAIGRVITNLGLVTQTAADREQTLGTFVAELQRLATGLAGDRDAIGASLGNIDALATATAGLLHDARPALDPALRDLQQLVAVLAAKDATLDTLVKQLPKAVAALSRGLSYGAWLNLYVLDVVVNVDGNRVPVPPSVLEAALRQGAVK